MSNQFRTAEDYQNHTYNQFWRAYSRYHLSDMLELAISLLDTLDSTKEKEKKHQKKYKKELLTYYTNMSKALQFWYNRQKEFNPEFKDLKCPFEMNCLEIIQIIRYSPNRKMKHEEEKYTKYEIEIFFKHMKAHIVDIIIKTSEFIRFDMNSVNTVQVEGLPPQIER